MRYFFWRVYEGDLIPQRNKNNENILTNDHHHKHINPGTMTYHIYRCTLMLVHLWGSAFSFCPTPKPSTTVACYHSWRNYGEHSGCSSVLMSGIYWIIGHCKYYITLHWPSTTVECYHSWRNYGEHSGCSSVLMSGIYWIIGHCKYYITLHWPSTTVECYHSWRNYGEHSGCSSVLMSGIYYTIVDFWWGLLMTKKNASGIGWPTPNTLQNAFAVYSLWGTCQ